MGRLFNRNSDEKMIRFQSQVHKERFILICLCIALCVLVVGMQIRYNKDIQPINEYISECNEKLEEKISDEENN